jgi:hypothetical protein
MARGIGGAFCKAVHSSSWSGSQQKPAAAEHQEGFRLIRKHTTPPLAVGEVFNTIWDAVF